MSRFRRFNDSYIEDMFPGPMMPGVKGLVIANGAVFLALTVLNLVNRDFAYGVLRFFAFSHPYAIMRAHVWQFFTYMFVHMDPMHIVFNLLSLYFFGGRLEMRWGTREFLKFYAIVGVGAAVIHELFSLFAGDAAIPMFGASGAIYGVLLLYAIYWKDDIIYVFMIVPVKVKYLVGFMVFIAFVSSAGMLRYREGSGDGIAHFTHLGGLLVAWLYYRYGDRGGRAMRNATRYFSKDFGRRRPKPVKLPRRPQYRDEDAWRRTRTA